MNTVKYHNNECRLPNVYIFKHHLLLQFDGLNLYFYYLEIGERKNKRKFEEMNANKNV